MWTPMHIPSQRFERPFSPEGPILSQSYLSCKNDCQSENRCCTWIIVAKLLFSSVSMSGDSHTRRRRRHRGVDKMGGGEISTAGAGVDKMGGGEMQLAPLVNLSLSDCLSMSVCNQRPLPDCRCLARQRCLPRCPNTPRLPSSDAITIVLAQPAQLH
jgi:hypothetical protein